MPANSQSLAPPARSSLWSAFLPLLPLMLAVFDAFVGVGMALPVVPRHVHDALGQGTVMVGFVMGAQYVSSLFGRIWSGGITDERGARVAALAGFLAVCGVGTLYLASVPFVASSPDLALAIVIAARLATGFAESFVITSTMAWGLARMGPTHAGKVFGWMGVALFGGLAAGAPIGTALQARFGFGGVALAVLAAGVVGTLGTGLIAPVAPTHHHERPPFRKVLGALKVPGLGLTLCCIGYAMLNAFAVLLFAQRGWAGGALALTSMGLGFVAARLLLGHLPDQIGGARIALYCVLGEALGLTLIWAAPHPALAWTGAALAGGGYGIGFQGFGVEAVKRTPPQSRGAAMGAYVIFQDIAMGLSPPLGGALAHVAGLDAVYLAAAVGAVAAAFVAAALIRENRVARS